MSQTPLRRASSLRQFAHIDDLSLRCIDVLLRATACRCILLLALPPDTPAAFIGRQLDCMTSLTSWRSIWLLNMVLIPPSNKFSIALSFAEGAIDFSMACRRWSEQNASPVSHVAFFPTAIGGNQPCLRFAECRSVYSQLQLILSFYCQCA